MTEEKENTFVGAFETMDLTKLYDKTFVVAIGTGKPDSSKILPSTILAPLDFDEMVGAVSDIWVSQTLHAKVFLTRKNLKDKFEMLDANTIDYIESKYLDILTERIFLKDDVQYTCEATILEATDETNSGTR